MTAPFTADAPVDQPPALKLTPGIGLGTPSVEIKWELSDGAIRQLAEMSVGNPFLLVVVTNDNEETSRYVFSIKRESKRFIRMHAPGLNRVHATVVWLSNGQNPTNLIFKRNDSGDYRMALVEVPYNHELDRIERQVSDLTWEKRGNYRTLGSDDVAGITAEIDRLEAEARDLQDNQHPVIRERFDDLRRLPEEATLELPVDESHFAHPKKNNKLVTRLLAKAYKWDRVAIDPCEVRKRAYFIVLPTIWLAYPVWLILFLLVELFDLLVIGFLLLLGKRWISNSPLRHPFSLMPPEIWEDMGPSIWTTKLSETDHLAEGGRYYNGRYYRQKSRPGLLVMFCPPFLVFYAGMFLFAGLIHGSHPAVTSTVLYLAACLLIGSFLGNLVVLLAAGRLDKRQAARAALQASRPVVPPTDSLVEALTQANRNTHQGFSYRKERIKARVCQPFPRTPGSSPR